MLERGLFDDKKGQEGITLGTLLLIILGIVVVVIIIIGATQGFDFFFGKIDTLPGQSLQAAVSSCGIAAESGLKVDYCTDLKEVEIDGEEQYVTCEYLGEQGYLEQELSSGCGDLKIDRSTFCRENNLKSNDLVNGFNCPVQGSYEITASPESVELAKDESVEVSFVVKDKEDMAVSGLTLIITVDEKSIAKVTEVSVKTDENGEAKVEITGLKEGTTNVGARTGNAREEIEVTVTA